jgi:hypothetical protein
MEREDFAIALSERDAEEAIREVSLKIKAVFPKQINCLIILYTPQYNPLFILETINLTLKPNKVLGLQAPLLIFEGKLIQKGVIACCINKEGVEWKENLCESKDPQEIELFLNSSFRKLKGEGVQFLSFASAQINPLVYISKARISLGRVFNFLGSGYIKKYSSFHPQIINNTLSDGLVNIAIKGLQITYSKLGGYLPIAKPFTVTKASPSRGIITEINGQPAIDIYKYYLEEKFEIFKKNHLFSFYPLGIIDNEEQRLINVIDYLEDGSLVCIGEVPEGSRGYIMFFDPQFLLENLEKTLGAIKEENQGLIFVINSLTRRKILREHSEGEMKLTKQILGDKFKMVGLYSDYYFFSDKKTGDIDVEAADSLIALWK